MRCEDARHEAEDGPECYRVAWTTSDIEAFVRVESPDTIEIATRGRDGGWKIRDVPISYLHDVDRASIAVVEEIDEMDSPWPAGDTRDK